MEVKKIQRELAEAKEEKRRERSKFNVEGWSDEELELFEEMYTSNIKDLVEMFPEKNRAELLKAQKDRINRELILTQENYSDEEKQLIISADTLTYREINKLLPNRSIWSIMKMSKMLGIKKGGESQPFRKLTEQEYDLIAKLKSDGVTFHNICKGLSIKPSQLKFILYTITDNADVMNFRNKYPNIVQRKSDVNKWTEEEDNILIRYTKENCTREVISRILGISVDRVRRRQCLLGFKNCNTEYKEHKKNKKADKGEHSLSKEEWKNLSAWLKEYKVESVSDLREAINNKLNSSLDLSNSDDKTTLLLNMILPYFKTKKIANNISFGQFKGTSFNYLYKSEYEYLKYILTSSVSNIVDILRVLDLDDILTMKDLFTKSKRK